MSTGGHSLHKNDWMKIAALTALAATGAGAAGVGPLAGVMGGEAAAAGAAGMEGGTAAALMTDATAIPQGLQGTASLLGGMPQLTPAITSGLSSLDAGAQVGGFGGSMIPNSAAEYGLFGNSVPIGNQGVSLLSHVQGGTPASWAKEQIGAENYARIGRFGKAAYAGKMLGGLISGAPPAAGGGGSLPRGGVQPATVDVGGALNPIVKDGRAMSPEEYRAWLRAHGLA